MALTPEEIEQHAFRERFRGYDPDEVDAFLDRVVGALRAAERERDAALAARDEAQQQAGESETLLRDTLVNAQRTAEQTVADARADAERIRQRAHERAERILGDTRAQAHEIAEAIEELLGVHERLRESIRATLDEHADLLDRSGQLPPTAEVIDRLRRIAEQPVSADSVQADAAGSVEADSVGADAADSVEADAAGADAPVGWPEPPDARNRANTPKEQPE